MSNFENGTIFVNGEKLHDISAIEWSKHPKFAGVYMKNLFVGNEGNFKALLVKIDPHHEIGNHIHEGEDELHEIISGEGSALVGTETIPYNPGAVSFIPSDIEHNIKAGEGGLVLLAKFSRFIG